MKWPNAHVSVSAKNQAAATPKTVGKFLSQLNKERVYITEKKPNIVVNESNFETGRNLVMRGSK